MTLRATLLGAAAVGLLSTGRAQDAHFTQFYAAPTYISPAFAGTSLQSRFSMIYRDQWPSIPGAFVSYAAAFDHYAASMNSGLGVQLFHDRSGSGALRYTSVTGQYAYEIELKRKVFLRPALELAFVNHAVDYSRLTFGDQLARGGAVATYENMDGRSVNYTDAGFGLLYFTPTTWLGCSVHHLNQPNQSLLMNESKVPRKLSLHGGRRFVLRSGVIKKHKQNIVAAFNYRAQEKYDQLDLGFYYEQHPFYAGLWFRGMPLFKSYTAGYGSSDAVTAVVGLMVGDWRFGYSYDLTVSKLAGHTAGSHEISTVVEFADRRTRRAKYKKRSIPCAKF